ncbi:YfhE family protein [Aquibacillus koreensis]|uniref:YfhE family protein n=1 Tax=Aquibacillus koreensis TaxID=279446 RepID=A0A9X3WMS2_9BACI|nr:YfhE family protein [Aquibacillus koreensis]MCT2534388.1 YfhE family protein [Aquibacillus koreensis]MDC3421695.1 YfhE family protein [Aquibacillus koreensis]
MKGKTREDKARKNGLSKTQQVLYQKEFKAANRMYNDTKNQV